MRFPPWGDLLTTYNNTEVTYDEIGNPNGYGIRSFTWEHGRQLAAQTRNGVEWEYSYGADGMLTKRSSDSKTYEYVYSGDKLVQMTITKHTTNPETVQLVELSYDAAGQPLTMTLDGVIYYYVLNFQGDVVGMVDGNGNLQMAVNYNGYGTGFYYAGVSNMMSTLSGANPLGYRGYVADLGTGLYYLQSRYYDPEIGRFINADGLVSTGQGLLGNNMFAYCLNNPIGMIDIGGEDAIYVVDYGPDGLPVVGHSRLYIQDEEGNWYVTQYSGKFPFPWTARVMFDVPAGYYQEELDKILNNEQTEHIQYVYIEGDFSESCDAAENYKDTNYGGYDLLFNNCMHYVREIMMYGEYKDPAIRDAICASPAIAPSSFYNDLMIAKLSGIVNGAGIKYEGDRVVSWR